MTKFHHLLAGLVFSAATVGAVASSTAGTLSSVLDSLRPSQRQHQPASGPALQNQGNKQQADFRNCPQFFFNGASPAVAGLQQWKPRALCFDAFAVLHSGNTKTPLFVAERLNRDHLIDAADEKRTNRFFADARLPSAERAQPSDYKKSGFDQGHMAPAADMPNAQAMAQSFSLANMVPQAPKNNRRTWKGIENATRKYVMRAKGDVYVITGPVFNNDSQTIGQGEVRVPNFLYKLVYDSAENRAWAHWIENTDEARANRPITYNELKSRTGIEFLPGAKPKTLDD